MPLTPEQFDKLVTKDEFNEFKDEMMEMKSDVKKLLSSMDSQAKILNSIKDEQAANIGAPRQITLKQIYLTGQA
jgi:hypothetical protein